MKKTYIFKYIILMFIIQSIILICGVVSNAVTVDKIKVGLIFKEPKFSVDKSSSMFSLNSNNGLEIGIQNTRFEKVFEEPTSSPISVVKSVYIKNINAGFVSNNYTATTSNTYFIVKLNETFQTSQDVENRGIELKARGINSFKMYNGTWQLWMGTYPDRNLAQFDITNVYSALYSQGSFSILDPSNSRFFIYSQNNLIMVDGSFNRIRIRPLTKTGTPLIKINSDSKRAYRGEMEVYFVGTSGITLVNELSLEEYLYGVVPYELESSAPIEALKAQAVAARTYAIITMNKYASLGFNLCNTTVCQVYGGYYGEASSSNNAINQTRGKIVTYNGNPASTFFFSSSGGATEDSENVWGSSVPYLRSVVDKYESGKSWNYNWQSTFSAISLKQTMEKRGFDLGNIIGINITKKTNAGRALEVVLSGTKSSRTYKKDDTRNFLSLPSQLYEVSTDADVVVKVSESENKKMSIGGMKVLTVEGQKTVSPSDGSYIIIDAAGVKKNLSTVPTNYIFKGKGWGHALGMSQEGAKGMAKQGYDYIQILTYYYQGTKVE